MKELKNIFIDSTEKTPQVDFNILTGELILAGRSIPENATEIYEPLYRWVNEYINNSRPTTNLRLNLEYFNTASSIWIARIVKSLSKIQNPENVLFIHLYFHIEEFDNMEIEDIKDALSPVVDIVSNSTISIGIKIYGTDDKGVILKESMVLI
ncbi:MAG: hypothetical protein C0408_02015 [Odoribacter sp.]|nr:hypothetical protein [Odoribacter sp.]